MADEQKIFDDEEQLEGNHIQPDANDSDDEDKEPSYNNKMYYSVENNYSSGMLEDIYNPEEHYNKIQMTESLSAAVDSMIEANPKYTYLRSIDVSKATNGDKIYLIKQADEPILRPTKKNENIEVKVLCTIVDRVGEDYFLSDDNDNSYIVKKSDIRPVDEYINKLKSSDISFIYVNVKKFMSNINNEIEYFDIFSTYFRLHEKVLYCSLSFNEQQILLKELEKATGILGKKNIIPLW